MPRDSHHFSLANFMNTIQNIISQKVIQMQKLGPNETEYGIKKCNCNGIKQLQMKRIRIINGTRYL